MDKEMGYSYDSNNLKIYDSSKFIEMLYTGTEVESKELYKKLSEYAFKQKGTIAKNIPMEEYKGIINFALMKTISDFKEEKGASFESFFYFKLRGEVKSYISKRDILQKKVLRVKNEGDYSDKDIGYGYQKGEDKENTLEAIDFSDIAEIMNQEEKTKRQMKAFRMAFSGIPKELQYILYKVGEGSKIREIADIMGLEENEVSVKRNNGLSLILQRVLRGRHLLEEDKIEIAQMNGLVYEPSEFEDKEDYFD